METLLLTGIAAGAMASALTSFLLFMKADSFEQAVFWLLGSFALADWRQVGAIAPYVVLLPGGRPVVRQGHEPPGHGRRGGPVPRLSGRPGAEDLPGPGHAARRPLGLRERDHRVRRPRRPALGPHPHRAGPPLSVRLFLPGRRRFPRLCDLLARTLLFPTELPIGVITAAVGAPFFIYLLKQEKNKEPTDEILLRPRP